MRANIDGTVAVLEAARHSGVRRVVNFFSECAAGNVAPDAPVDESLAPRPTTPYGATKATGESSELSTGSSTGSRSSPFG